MVQPNRNSSSSKRLNAEASTESSTSEVQRELKKRLLALNFHACARTIAALLEEMGYLDVRLAGRKDWRGRNRHGGYDIEAMLPAIGMNATSGKGRRRVLVQIKQFDQGHFVYQRGIDELRGVCLRVGASEALLITTGQFAPSVEQRNALALLRNVDAPVAPVRLLDGDGLTREMLAHRFGVWEEAGESAATPSRFGVDARFFEEIAARASEGNSRADYPSDLQNAGQSLQRQAQQQEQQRYEVTVQVTPLPASGSNARKNALGGTQAQQQSQQQLSLTIPAQRPYRS